MNYIASDKSTIFGNTYNGVPNPVVPHMHEYPTRFHGPVWRTPDVSKISYRPSPYMVNFRAPVAGMGAMASSASLSVTHSHPITNITKASPFAACAFRIWTSIKQSIAAVGVTPPPYANPPGWTISDMAAATFSSWRQTAANEFLELMEKCPYSANGSINFWGLIIAPRQTGCGEVDLARRVIQEVILQAKNDGYIYYPQDTVVNNYYNVFKLAAQDARQMYDNLSSGTNGLGANIQASSVHIGGAHQTVNDPELLLQQAASAIAAKMLPCYDSSIPMNNALSHIYLCEQYWGPVADQWFRTLWSVYPYGFIEVGMGETQAFGAKITNMRERTVYAVGTKVGLILGITTAYGQALVGQMLRPYYERTRPTSSSVTAYHSGASGLGAADFVSSLTGSPTGGNSVMDFLVGGLVGYAVAPDDKTKFMWAIAGGALTSVLGVIGMVGTAGAAVYVKK